MVKRERLLPVSNVPTTQSWSWSCPLPSKPGRFVSIKPRPTVTAEITKAEGIKRAHPQRRGRGAGDPTGERGCRQVFIGNAQMLRKLEAVEKALSQNAKIVVPDDTELINVIGELAGVSR